MNIVLKSGARETKNGQMANQAWQISTQLSYAATGRFDIPVVDYLLVKSHSWWLLETETKG